MLVTDVKYIYRTLGLKVNPNCVKYYENLNGRVTSNCIPHSRKDPWTVIAEVKYHALRAPRVY